MGHDWPHCRLAKEFYLLEKKIQTHRISFAHNLQRRSRDQKLFSFTKKERRFGWILAKKMPTIAREEVDIKSSSISRKKRGDLARISQERGYLQHTMKKFMK